MPTNPRVSLIKTPPPGPESRRLMAREGTLLAHGAYGSPEDRVFIDGRNEIHATLLHEIAEALDDGRAWSALLDRYGIQAAIRKHYNKRKMPKPKQMEKLAKSWEPYRSVACWYLWRSLDIKTP